MTKKEIGNLGEDYTAKYLESKGCEILARNFTVKGGELDIVAKKGDVIHIVEVKSRMHDPLVSGSAAITIAKQKCIIRATNEFIRRFEVDCSCIFDVALVEVSNGRVTDFSYIQRAFTA